MAATTNNISQSSAVWSIGKYKSRKPRRNRGKGECLARFYNKTEWRISFLSLFYGY